MTARIPSNLSAFRVTRANAVSFSPSASSTSSPHPRSLPTLLQLCATVSTPEELMDLRKQGEGLGRTFSDEEKEDQRKSRLKAARTPVTSPASVERRQQEQDQEDDVEELKSERSF